MRRDEAISIIDKIVDATHSSSDLGMVLDYITETSDCEVLISLLTSSDSSIVASGMYVVSELGQTAAPLLNISIELMAHENYRVRYWAMNSVMCCTDAVKAAQLIKEKGLVTDDFDLTRSRAKEFLDKLRAGRTTN